MDLRRMLVAATIVCCLPGSLSAAVQRTFVSRSGNDANACSFDLPCRTFGAAIAQTLAGGEVIVLDSAGYGPVTVTQAVSITSPQGVYAGISVFSGDGITINAGTSDVVTLRNLSVNYIGGTGHGITIASAGGVEVDHCRITGSFSDGISISPPAATALPVVVSDSTIRGTSIAGIVANDYTILSVLRSRFEANNSIGVEMLGGNSFASISDSSFTGNNQAYRSFNSTTGQIAGCQFLKNTIAVALPAGGQVTIDRSNFADNGTAVELLPTLTAAITHSTFIANTTAIEVNGTFVPNQTDASISDCTCTANTTCVIATSAAAVHLAGNTITKNSTGIFINLSNVESLGNNLIRANGTDVSGSLTPVTGQ